MCLHARTIHDGSARSVMSPLFKPYLRIAGRQWMHRLLELSLMWLLHGHIYDLS